MLYSVITEFLKLNEEALLKALDGCSYLYLLPKQTYINVNEDAASALERKRNYIYCLIVQIMKAEKEMHIDNLVFRVRLCGSVIWVLGSGGSWGDCFVSWK